MILVSMMPRSKVGLPWANHVTNLDHGTKICFLSWNWHSWPSPRTNHNFHSPTSFGTARIRTNIFQFARLEMWRSIGSQQALAWDTLAPEVCPNIISGNFSREMVRFEMYTVYSIYLCYLLIHVFIHRFILMYNSVWNSWYDILVCPNGNTPNHL